MAVMTGLDAIVPLLTSQNVKGHIHLIIGGGALANSRANRCLKAGAAVIVVTDGPIVHHGLLEKAEAGQIVVHQRQFQNSDLHLGRSQVADNIVDAVFIATETQGRELSYLCQRLRIPVNVVDEPELCSFTLLSTHSDGPLHIGVTTSGHGCKLAARIRREIAATLPAGLGQAVERLGKLRRQIWEQDKRFEARKDSKCEARSDQDGLNHAALINHSEKAEPHGAEALVKSVEEKPTSVGALGAGNQLTALANRRFSASDDDGPGQKATFNKLVTEDNPRTRRMRWLAQICEYWPLKRLALVSDDELTTILESYRASAPHSTTPNGHSSPASAHPTTTTPPRRRPQIILAGAGPGSPQLLTLAAHRALHRADVVLADKLVPAAVLELVPRRTPLRIARKFPGNADAAQAELLALGLAALQRGETVLRLKQGDPFLYGRGGEEVAFFREHGFEPVVVPGIASALAAPLLAGVPVTQREVADQLLVCTGTGRRGCVPVPPGYVEGRTVVELMALHRLRGLVESFTGRAVDEDGKVTDKVGGEAVPRADPLWPLDVPCAVIERASCPDQRVIRSTLEHIVAAIEEVGSRPPGLIVIGKSCAVLEKVEGRWKVEEGFGDFQDLESEPQMILQSLSNGSPDGKEDRVTGEAQDEAKTQNAP